MNTRAVLSLLVSSATAGLSLPCVAQTASHAMRTALVAKSVYFEGEPIYLLAELRNTSSRPQEAPSARFIDDEVEIEVRSASGRDMRQERTVADYFGGLPRDTLVPGAATHWVTPIHWRFGTYREDADIHTYYAFAPGDYVIRVIFPARYSIPPESLAFSVRVRNAREDDARRRFLTSVARAYQDVRRNGRADAALPQLLAMGRDPALAPFRVQTLSDVAAGLLGAARVAPQRYAHVVDSVKIALMPVLNATEQIRLIQSISSDRLEQMATNQELSRIPFLQERLRRVRRGPQR